MQQHSFYSTVSAAAALDVDSTTIQRAIVRGELEAERRGTTKQARYRISRDALAAWAAANDKTFKTSNGDVDPSTGEVLEAPAELPAAAQVPEVPQFGATDYVRPISNVKAIVAQSDALVAADRLALLVSLVKAGQDDAARIVIGAWGL